MRLLHLIRVLVASGLGVEQSRLLQLDRREDAMTPTLLDWCVLRLRWEHIGRDPSYHLMGIVLGHPLLMDQHQIVTSPLRLLAADESWARTMSRYYLLQLRLPHSMAERIRRYELFKISIRFGVPVGAIDFDADWPGPRPLGPMPTECCTGTTTDHPSRRASRTRKTS